MDGFTNFHPNLCELFNNIFLALQIAEFVIKLQYTSHSFCQVTKEEIIHTMATRSDPISGIYLFKVATSLE